MLDKKANVRQLALKRLGSVYRAYVTRFADVETPMEESQRFDWVPSALLRGARIPIFATTPWNPSWWTCSRRQLSAERRSLFWLQALCKMDERASKAFTFMLRARNRPCSRTCADTSS